MVGSDSVIYRPRLVDRYLDDLLEQLPALLVIGPRATGKTTTMERRAATRVQLDVAAQAAAFEADPAAALRSRPEPVLLDEWQNVPAVLTAVKRAVDADPRPNRFYATGSVRAELENAIWPGTGRLVRIVVHPMTIREQLGRVNGSTVFDRLAEGERLTAPADPPDLRGYIDLALRSGFPAAALQFTGQARTAWLESYIDDILTHDIEQLEEPEGRRRDSARLRSYLEAYALNSAGIVDHKAIYEAAEINKVTAMSYERLLTDLLVVDRVPAWSSNRLKRLVRRPKRYMADAALMAASLRFDEQGVLSDGGVLGRFLETFVVGQLRPEAEISRSRPRLHHLRTEGGRQEVDILVELGGKRVIGIEIKAGAAPTARDARHLAWLRDRLGDRFLAGVVFHTGPDAFQLNHGIQAAPIATLWS
jgi:predicted AAA+ superfamily ATPase